MELKMSVLAFVLWGAAWFVTTLVAVSVANSLLEQNRLHLVEAALVLSNTALFVYGMSAIY